MKLIRANWADLDAALAQVNKRYDGNIKLQDVRPNGTGLRFSLRVKSLDGPGTSVNCRQYPGDEPQE